jgi:ribosomal-protein-alanine N-acetyltransferase
MDHSIWGKLQKAKMNIRPACESDLPALIELAQRSWLSGFALAPAEMIRERLARQFEQDWYPRYWRTMTIAEEGGMLLGVVQPEGNEVNGLWVAPESQGQGVGTALLRHAESQIAAAGHNWAWLTCSGFNTAAIGFYMARAYRETSRSVKDRGAGLVEELITFERRFATTLDTLPRL